MRVAIVGAGPIGRATAAYLAHHGHAAGIWSPSGESLAALTAEGNDRVRLTYEGALSGSVSVERIATPRAIGEYDVVLIALPGHAYPAVLPGVVDALRRHQLVIVSGALS